MAKKIVQKACARSLDLESDDEEQMRVAEEMEMVMGLVMVVVIWEMLSVATSVSVQLVWLGERQALQNRVQTRDLPKIMVGYVSKMSEDLGSTRSTQT